MRFVPVGEINLLTGQGRHRAELGRGSLIYDRKSPADDRDDRYSRRLNPVVFSRIGYHFQQPEGGLFVRAGFTPGIALDRSNYVGWRGSAIFWWAGIGMGKSF
ncbi:hypothetical protein ACFQ4C_21360 [Larkinella insperata]|uniref:Uncharacterized protein n=1 Tax=Larkinella insperata TaxID=332158 RepID=A0ABW3QHB2_9BACT